MQIVGNGNHNAGRTTATFSPLIICQTVADRNTLPKTTKVETQGDVLQENKMQSLSRGVSEVQFAAKRPVDFETRKKEDLSKDGVGKNV